jgi:hypothetical protein
VLGPADLNLDLRAFFLGKLELLVASWVELSK